MAVLPAASAPSTKSSKLAAVRGVVPSAKALPASAAAMQARAKRRGAPFLHPTMRERRDSSRRNASRERNSRR